MKRGAIWTVSGGLGFAGKPRPALIVQDDRFDDLSTVTVCGFTTVEVDVRKVRLLIEPNGINGLSRPCQVMVDKMMTVSTSKLGQRIGRLDDRDMQRVNQALLVFLGLAGPQRSKPPT